MSQTTTSITTEVIEKFLEGTNPQKYIVGIEAGYDKAKVTLIINDRDTNEKRMEEYRYKPFLWFKENITTVIYGGNKTKIRAAAEKHGIRMIKLKTDNSDGFTPLRLEYGYKFLATCTKSYNDLINFFKYGGVDPFSKEYQKNFVMFSPAEQYLIQSGKRLFKGMDDYNDVHRFQFDLETEGLFARRDAIFQIGVRDNRGFEGVIETIGARTKALHKELKDETDEQKRQEILTKLDLVTDTPEELRQSERENIARFFQVIDMVQPDIITGYNSENFDWPFIFERADRLNMDVTELAITLNRISKIKRKPSSLKLGGETETYNQTHMYGYSIIDISHAVRRAMAINSEIKGWGLKYITQYSEIAKPNRVYVPGDKINTTWVDKKNKYAFNNENGDWYKITDKAPLKEKYTIKTGAYIVQRYLCDDLWETEQIDNIFNQASFLISKILPTSFQRSSTMGTAGQWKLIMAAWSYENGLAIPATQEKREFTGGLSRLLEVGFAKDVYKLDYAALYPKTQLTHGIFPDLDISGVMMGMLTYVVDTRDKFKFLTGTEKKKAEKLSDKLKAEKHLMTPKEIEDLTAEITKHKALQNLYDKKQLPLKILANSWFGSYGAPYIFNWGDTDSAEETTCRGRQYLRLMIRWFKETYGFRPLVMDTDGANLAAPANLQEITYLAKGTHWKTESNANKQLFGIEAVLAEFNETFMEGRMGLDLDDICTSTINFARKNYANDIKGKIKLVGNSVKSKKMSVYIEEFLGKGIRMLLDGDGYSFINYYYEYVDKIYNYQIPLVKIATKARVKLSIADYKKKATMKNKAGNPLPKQAHMELAMRAGIDITLGDTLYYVNTGSAKSHGDLKTITTNPMTKKQIDAYVLEHGKKPVFNKAVELNCELIDGDLVEKDFEMLKEMEMLKKALSVVEEGTDTQSIDARIMEIEGSLQLSEYNVARYLENFNKKVKPLLVCFNEEVRNNILLGIDKTKDKKTKIVTETLQQRQIFEKSECELISGIPFKEGDQDSYEDLMKMEDKEIKFWDKVDMLPNNMEQEEWDAIRVDYHERLIQARIYGIQREKDALEEIYKHLEVKDLNNAMLGELPIDVFILSDIADDDSGALISRKWNEPIGFFNDIFKYEAEAIKRNDYYVMAGISPDDLNRYEYWLDYNAESIMMTGSTPSDNVQLDLFGEEQIVEVIKKVRKTTKKPPVKAVEEVKKPVLADDEDADDSALTYVVDTDGNLVRTDDIVVNEDGFDDTFGDMPDGYIVTPNLSEEQNKENIAKAMEALNKKEEQPKDEWGF
jgi:DNA polymerase elongation subunit (family B)